MLGFVSFFFISDLTFGTYYSVSIFKCFSEYKLIVFLHYFILFCKGIINSSSPRMGLQVRRILLSIGRNKFKMKLLFYVPVLDGEKNILGYTPVTSIDLHQLQPAGEALLISMSFEQALKKMFLSGNQFLPVVDSQNHFVGFFDFTHTCKKMKNACQSWQ